MLHRNKRFFSSSFDIGLYVHIPNHQLLSRLSDHLCKSHDLPRLERAGEVISAFALGLFLQCIRITKISLPDGFPLVTGLFFNAIWLLVKRVFTMLKTTRDPASQEQLEVTNLGDTDIEQSINFDTDIKRGTSLGDADSEHPSVGLVTASTEQEL